jgi:16S rRNA (guanine1207-N2)-methyltransferase
MVAGDYNARFEFFAALAGEPVVVVSKPGLQDGHEVSAAQALCAELIAPAREERVLLLGCGHGALGVALARRLAPGGLTLHDPSLIALRMATATLAANGVAAARVSDRISLLPDEAGQYDRVLLLVPSSRALGRRWLVEAHELLRPGGLLHVAGPNKGGAQPLIADAAALFGGTRLLGYGGGSRLAESLRLAKPPTPPAWAGEDGIAPGSWFRLLAELPEGAVELLSLPGVFSAERLDPGTALLVQRLELRPGLRLLDAGCGYGAIGIAAARAGAAHVDLLDVNMLAVAAARENVGRLGLAERATVRPSDALEAGTGPYDLIASNPPFHAGKQVETSMAHAFFAQARALLAPSGRIAIVANQFLPYERELATYFPRLTRLAEDRSYKILVGEIV